MYKVICMIPDRCFFYWDGNFWSESAEQARTWESLEEATKVYKRHAHRRNGVSKVYTVRLLDMLGNSGNSSVVLERKGDRAAKLERQEAK